MRFHRWLVLSCALVIVSGCATLFAGGNETVRIESSPSGATVRAQNGQTLGTTPFTTTLKPKDYLLTFSAPGYPEASYSLDKKVDGIAFLNLFCVLCWGVDFATGSVWGLSDDFVNVQMGGGGAPVAYSPPAAVAAPRGAGPEAVRVYTSASQVPSAYDRVGLVYPNPNIRAASGSELLEAVKAESIVKGGNAVLMERDANGQLRMYAIRLK